MSLRRLALAVTLVSNQPEAPNFQTVRFRPIQARFPFPAGSIWARQKLLSRCRRFIAVQMMGIRHGIKNSLFRKKDCEIDLIPTTLSKFGKILARLLLGADRELDRKIKKI